MASSLKHLSDYDSSTVPSAVNMKIGVIVTDYHTEITYALLEGCCNCLEENDCKPENVIVKHVPGAFELPLAAKWLYEGESVDAVIVLGCVITGDTRHDEYINHQVARGIMNLNLEYGIPFVFGLLTPSTEQQAKDRAGGKYGNKGVETAITAIKMITLNQSM